MAGALFVACAKEAAQTVIRASGRTVETPVKARAGFLDRPVLMVLGGGLSLLFAAIFRH